MSLCPPYFNLCRSYFSFCSTPFSEILDPPRSLHAYMLILASIQANSIKISRQSVPEVEPPTYQAHGPHTNRSVYERHIVSFLSVFFDSGFSSTKSEDFSFVNPPAIMYLSNIIPAQWRESVSLILSENLSLSQQQ